MSDVPPLVYAMIYFSMIPILASFYYWMPPGTFYAPYTRFEPTIAGDIGRIATMLEEAFKRSLEGREIAVAGAKLTDLRVFNLRSTDGSTLSFNVMGVFRPFDDPQKRGASPPQPFA